MPLAQGQCHDYRAFAGPNLRCAGRMRAEIPAHQEKFPSPPRRLPDLPFCRPHLVLAAPPPLRCGSTRFASAFAEAPADPP